MKSLEGVMSVGNMEKISHTMDKFENVFVNMEVQLSLVEKSMAGMTSLTTPEEEVRCLMQEVADEYGLEVSVELPQAGSRQVDVEEKGNCTVVGSSFTEEELSKRLADLKAKG